MTAIKQKLTFEEYLNHEDGTDRHHELVAGELVEMPPEGRGNSKISLFLLTQLSQLFDLDLLCHKDTEVEVTGSQAQTRLPDLMLLTSELAEILGNRRGTITRDMPPPFLAIEVVSPGQSNKERDYRYKRSEYAARGIAEYWIVDPEEGKVTVLTLDRGLYADREHTGDSLIETQIQGLQLTANQVLRAKL